MLDRIVSRKSQPFHFATRLRPGTPQPNAIKNGILSISVAELRPLKWAVAQIRQKPEKHFCGRKPGQQLREGRHRSCFVVALLADRGYLITTEIAMHVSHGLETLLGLPRAWPASVLDADRRCP